jgi:ribonuclease HII
VAGVDEAGRGPLAGPVVAAAAVLPRDAVFEKLNDSKQMSEADRDELYEQLTTHPGVAYAV